MKKIQRLKSKKGFSLVELLIVIAIMAVLVGVLAPQYIRYLENTRQATDMSSFFAPVYHEFSRLTEDPMYAADFSTTGTYTVILTMDADGDIAITGTANADVLAEIINMMATPTTTRSNLFNNFAITYIATFNTATNRWVVNMTIPNNLPDETRILRHLRSLPGDANPVGGGGGGT
jgi:prepilin-type N-terminal cleavage/methylation domain-containing protein